MVDTAISPYVHELPIMREDGETCSSMPLLLLSNQGWVGTSCS